MDDFKRAVYIEARNVLVQSKFGYMCNALGMGFDKVIGINQAHFDDLTDEEMEYFFSELFAQFDKKYWNNERKWRYRSDSHSVWMHESFITERLALLDLLIDERL